MDDRDWATLQDRVRHLEIYGSLDDEQHIESLWTGLAAAHVRIDRLEQEVKETKRWRRFMDYAVIFAALVVILEALFGDGMFA